VSTNSTRFPYTTLFRSLGDDYRNVGCTVEITGGPERFRVEQKTPLTFARSHRRKGRRMPCGPRTTPSMGSRRATFKLRNSSPHRSEEHTSELQSRVDLV